MPQKFAKLTTSWRNVGLKWIYAFNVAFYYKLNAKNVLAKRFMRNEGWDPQVGVFWLDTRHLFVINVL